MTSRWFSSVAVGVVACVAGMAFGQEHEPSRPQWAYIIQEFVKPSMIKEYEATTLEMIEMLKEKEVDEHHVQFSTLTGPEMGYTFVIPIENFGAMDTMMENWQAAVAKMGDDWRKLEEKGSKAVERRASFHVVRRSDLSFEPEEPRLSPDEVKYIHYGFHYLIPGQEQAIEKLAHEFVKLYKDKGLNDAWTIYQSVTGADLPLYVVAFPGKSPADFYAREVEIQKALGEEGKYLGEQVMSFTRRYENKDAWLRPDLSYPPMED